MNNSQIKRLARIRLAGNWGNCIALNMTVISFAMMLFIGELLIYLTVCLIGGKHGSYLDYISTFQGRIFLACRIVIYYLLFVPEASNIRSIYISLAKGKSFLGTQWEVRHTSIKYYFKIILINTLGLLYQAVFLAPLAVCGLAISYYIEQCRIHINTRNLLMFMLCMVITIITLCVFLHFRIKIRLVPYLSVLRTDLGILDIFILSTRLMKKNIVRYIFFQLSFLHYLLLSLLVFPIIGIIPYYYMSVTVFCTSLASQQAVEDYLSSKASKGEQK